MACKDYAKIDARMRKITYKNLKPDQKKYVKAQENYNRLEREMNHFYRTCKRNNNGTVDFEHMTEQELDTFDCVYKAHQKAQKALSKFDDEEFNERAWKTFVQSNTHSASF